MSEERLPGAFSVIGFQDGMCVYPAEEFAWLHNPGQVIRR